MLFTTSKVVRQEPFDIKEAKRELMWDFCMKEPEADLFIGQVRHIQSIYEAIYATANFMSGPQEAKTMLASNRDAALAHVKESLIQQGMGKNEATEQVRRFAGRMEAKAVQLGMTGRTV